MSWRRQRWQYQIYTTGLPDQITTGGGKFESQWHQPYSDPQPNFVAKLRAVAGVALIASGVIAPVVLDKTQEPGNSYESTYHQPWSEPVRLQPAAISRAYEQQVLAHVPFNEDFGIVTKWHQPWSEPVRFKLRDAYFEVTTAGYDGTLEPGQAYTPWYQPLSEPVRVKPRAAYFETTTAGYSATIEPGNSYESTWHQPWTDPVRRKFFQGSIQEGIEGPVLATTTEVITVDKWFQPLSERLQVKQLATAQRDAAIFDPFPVAATSVIYAAAEVTGPIFSRSIDYQDIAYVPFVSGETITLDKWFIPYQDPVRTKLRPTEAPHYVSGWDNTLEPGAYTPWFAPWSDPVRIKPDIRAANQSVLAHVPFNEDFGIESKWHFPWSEPVRVKPRATDFPAYTSGWDSSLEPGAPYPDWFAPWREPVRIKPRATDFPAYFALDHFFEVVTQDKWAPQYPDFARRPVLATAHQQALVHVPFVEDTTFESKWHQPWSEPVRVKLRVGYFEPYTSGYDKTIEPGGYESTSHQPWSEPVRFKPRATEFQAYTSGWDSTLEPGAYTPWIYPWSEPVRVRQRLGTGSNQYEAYGFVFTNEVITVDKWFIPYQDPVRVKLSLRTGDNQDFFFDPQPFVSFSWYGWLPEPVKLKPGIPSTEQQFLAYDPFPFTKMDWFNWLGEPKRFLAGLPSSEQQAFTAGFVPIIPSVTNWFEPFNEPVRFRVFGTHLQKDTVFPYQNLATIIRFSRGYIIC